MWIIALVAGVGWTWTGFCRLCISSKLLPTLAKIQTHLSEAMIDNPPDLAKQWKETTQNPPHTPQYQNTVLKSMYETGYQGKFLKTG